MCDDQIDLYVNGHLAFTTNANDKYESLWDSRGGFAFDTSTIANYFSSANNVITIICYNEYGGTSYNVNINFYF